MKWQADVEEVRRVVGGGKMMILHLRPTPLDSWLMRVEVRREETEEQRIGDEEGNSQRL